MHQTNISYDIRFSCINKKYYIHNIGKEYQLEVLKSGSNNFTNNNFTTAEYHNLFEKKLDATAVCFNTIVLIQQI